MIIEMNNQTVYIVMWDNPGEYNNHEFEAVFKNELDAYYYVNKKSDYKDYFIIESVLK